MMTPQYDKRHLNLLYGFADRTLKLDLPEITITDHQCATLGKGTGRFECTSTGEMHLFVEPEEDIDLITSEDFFHNLRNEELADEKYILLSGATDHGLMMEAVRMPGRLYHGFKPDPITLRSIGFTSSGNSESYARLTLTTQDRIDLTYDNSPEADSLRAEAYKMGLPGPYCELRLADGETVQFRSLDAAKFVMTRHQYPTSEEQELVERSLLLAVSFVTGRKIRIQGHYETGKDNRTQLFSTPRVDSDTYFCPRRFDLKSDSSGVPYDYVMIAALQQYFANAADPTLEGLVELYLLSPTPMEAGSRSLLVCTLIEGLVNLLVVEPDSSDFKAARKLLVSHLRNASVEGVSENVKASLLRVLGNARPTTLRERLVLLADQLKLPVDETEIKTYKNLRDELAHGMFLHPFNVNDTESDRRFSSAAIVSNLCNKIILRAAGYTGNYTSFQSVPDWVHLRNMQEQMDAPRES